MISQEELQEFRRLKELADRAKSALDEDRDALMAREGEEIEEGPLTMTVGLRIVRAFSYDSMVELFGRAEADRLKALLPEKQSRVLNVGLSQ